MSIVRKLIVDQLLSKVTLKNALKHWWRPLGILEFKVLGNNLFFVEFEKIRDKERVLEGRSWAFEGSLFRIEDYVGIS